MRLSRFLNCMSVHQESNKLIGGNDFFSLEGTTSGGGINLYDIFLTDFIQLGSFQIG